MCAVRRLQPRLHRGSLEALVSSKCCTVAVLPPECIKIRVPESQVLGCSVDVVMVQGADPNVPRARKETGTYILDDGDERYDGATSIRQNASVTPVTRRVRAVETVSGVAHLLSPSFCSYPRALHAPLAHDTAPQDELGPTLGSRWGLLTFPTCSTPRHRRCRSYLFKFEFRWRAYTQSGPAPVHNVYEFDSSYSQTLSQIKKSRGTSTRLVAP